MGKVMRDIQTVGNAVLTRLGQSEANQGALRVAERRVVCCYLGHGLVISKGEPYVVLRGRDRMCMDCAERCRVIERPS